jgi:uncharacterized membrane protein (UPF0127 family)
MFNVLAVLAATVTIAMPSPATTTVHTPKAVLRLEVARTEQQREHGLMDRRTLPEHTGMIFVFDEDQPVQFWMKDTLVPLDMVFIAANGTVRSVEANVPAVPVNASDDKIPRRNGSAKYVIELPAGEAAKDGIRAGTRLPDVTAAAGAAAAASPASH